MGEPKKIEVDVVELSKYPISLVEGEHQFSTGLHKSILNRTDLDNFMAKSYVYKEFLSFVFQLNQATQSKPTTCRDNQPNSIVVDAVLILLGRLKGIDVEPEPVGLSRFGNPAFKTWLKVADSVIKEEITTILNLEGQTSKFGGAVDEVSLYLNNSFGNSSRIDYGTGHEANFICFLLVLFKLGYFKSTDMLSLVNQVFVSYLDLMRHLQFTYWLEPAGSQGVWGLDDYHFLPFLFGASQLIDHPHLKPKCIHNSEILEQFAPDYIYLGCIQFVNKVKPTASLRWHSPMLDDISAVKTWSKVNLGLIKMYLDQVLSKLPIMQHFLFGSILNYTTENLRPLEETCCDHEQVYALGQETPNCCSHRVPSAIGAKFSGVKEQPLREVRLPFD